MDPKTLSNHNCYKIDELHLDKGLLDTLVDAVYVLLLENSPRSESVYRQLNEYKLCRNVFVFNNKGYNNILILEDDFLLDERIRDPVILKEISEFVNTRDFNVYNLGVIGLPIDPWATHMRMFATGVAHAVIYSPQGKQRVLDEYKKDPCMTSPWISTLFMDFRGHDLWYNRFLEKQYSYKIPICYQIFPDTENKKEWQTSIGNFWLSLLKLTKQPKPGWDNLYMIFKLLSYVLYFVIVFSLYNLCKKM